MAEETDAERQARERDEAIIRENQARIRAIRQENENRRLDKKKDKK